MDMQILDCLQQIQKNQQEMLELLDWLGSHPELERELLDLERFRLKEWYARVSVEVLDLLRQSELAEASLFSELRREQEQKMRASEKESVLQRWINGRMEAKHD